MYICMLRERKLKRPYGFGSLMTFPVNNQETKCLYLVYKRRY
jgi:hypothetical protein